ncbi:hypothetical protein ES708_29562 [subsurface metagenome]
MSVETKKRVTTKELLREAGISQTELHEWIRKGFLPEWCGREFYGGQGSCYWYPVAAVELAKKVKAWVGQRMYSRAIRELVRREMEEL